jgi:hypothetical protein
VADRRRTALGRRAAARGEPGPNRPDESRSVAVGDAEYLVPQHVIESQGLARPHTGTWSQQMWCKQTRGCHRSRVGVLSRAMSQPLASPRPGLRAAPPRIADEVKQCGHPIENGSVPAGSDLGLNGTASGVVSWSRGQAEGRVPVVGVVVVSNLEAAVAEFCETLGIGRTTSTAT